MKVIQSPKLGEQVGEVQRMKRNHREFDCNRKEEVWTGPKGGRGAVRTLSFALDTLPVQKGSVPIEQD